MKKKKNHADEKWAAWIEYLAAIHDKKKYCSAYRASGEWQKRNKLISKEYAVVLVKSAVATSSVDWLKCCSVFYLWEPFRMLMSGRFHLNRGYSRYCGLWYLRLQFVKMAPHDTAHAGCYSFFKTLCKVESGYNDIGLCETLPVASVGLWFNWFFTLIHNITLLV